MSENERIIPINLEQEMKTSFISYAMAVIINRALPDVRDGLKPVHRRILYSMDELGLQPDKPFRKSARIVGDCLGKYHPHGDSSVYEAMVRLAQPFSTRYPLVEGHGNFGSVDGDGAAAMRYTEARLSKMATEMMADIEKDTVDFMPNFDETLMQPTVLPSRVPNLLINGSGGIAVGMATNIPPHNLGETVDALVAMIDKPDITVDELMQYLPGPDFPTGGIIMGKMGIASAYRTGRGKIVVRARAEIEQYAANRSRIIVTEIPYQVNKARLVERIAELVHEKRIEGISDLRDETDRTGMRIVIELKKDVNANVVLNLLYKHTAMQDTLCADGRARGMFQFYGANRSGRWAGRHIQLQNLPQNHLADLEEARSLVKVGDYDALQLLYEDIPDTLSQLIRTAFIPKEGYKFIVSDFSAIEARVLSFLAGETWRMEVFETGGDIYCASASQMFHVPVEKHGQNAHLRQKGKIAELALGYGGSVGALKAMGALEMGLQEDELQPLVASWREANPKIVQFWWDVDRAAKEAIQLRTETETHGIRFIYQSAMLFIELPSGRRLSYVKPRMGENQFGGDAITYEGTGGTKKWERIESYGPKIVENITQAISRDILAYAMRTLSHCFIVAHVHDELIIECPKAVSLNAICDQMGRTPPWIEGLTLRADGYETMFYKKD